VKIDNPLTGSVRIENSKARTTKSNTPTSASSTAPAADRVEITGASTQLNSLEDQLNQMDTSEAGKLEAIKQALADGNFQVNEEAVADALIQSSMEHLKRQGTR
jgi:negative regulator of flagellin synthesis FlgM